MSVVTSTTRAGVCVLCIDNPPVNATSQAVRSALQAAIAAAQADPKVQAIVIECAGTTFVAGADIKEFGLPPREPHLSEVIDCIERASKPVVAAIHGTALGGGFELALGCHYRVMTEDAKVGLPECSLGVIPGAGGIARLSRLADLSVTLDVGVFGRRLNGREAMLAGVADQVVKDGVGEAAEAFARHLVEAATKIRRTRDLPVRRADESVIAAAHDRVKKTSRGQNAPLIALGLIERCGLESFDDEIAQSRAAFRDLVISPQAKALRHAFFAERVATRNPALPVAKGTLDKVGVVGSGTMGTGITICLLDAGLTVTLVDNSAEKLAAGQATIEKIYDGNVAKGRIDLPTRNSRLARLRLASHVSDLADVDLVIEAVFEDMAIKKAVFAEIDAVVRPDAIIASNTSYLDVNELADTISHPERVVGMHFFSPAHLMPLLENVRTRQASPETLAEIQSLGRRIKKIPVLVGVSDGFVGNRMLSRRAREAYFMLEEGALPQQIDKVLFDFGFPMGQFQLNDLAGLDVAWRNRQGRLERLTPRERSITILDEIVGLGRHGQKTGAGFYRYDAQRKRSVDPEIDALIVAQSVRSGITRRAIGDEEILERCLYVMVNEAALLLDEGVAERPEEVDTIWLNAYGFPRYRGGPLFFADQVGLAKILERVRHFAATVGEAYWKPAPLLVRLGESGGSFYGT